MLLYQETLVIQMLRGNAIDLFPGFSVIEKLAERLEGVSFKNVVEVDVSMPFPESFVGVRSVPRVEEELSDASLFRFPVAVAVDTLVLCLSRFLDCSCQLVQCRQGVRDHFLHFFQLRTDRQRLVRGALLRVGRGRG